jgi:hypothetical protein
MRNYLEEPAQSEIYLGKCKFVHHKTHTDSPWFSGEKQALISLVKERPYLDLMFTGPCIVIIFQYIIPTRCTSHRAYFI